MKKLLFLTLVLLCTCQLYGQRELIKAAKRLQPTEEFENIHVQKLFSDPRATVFVIWIKENVRLHKHAVHTETVHLLKGKGTMRLGQKMLEVRKGDIIFIPEGTPHGVRVKGGTMKVISVQSPEFKGKDRIFLDVEQ